MALELDILEIARDFGLVRVKERGREVIFRCPFCGDSRKRQSHGHLYINPGKGLFKCHRCGEEGNALQLYAYLRGIDTKEAYRELRNQEREYDIRPVKNKTLAPRAINPGEYENRFYPVYRELMHLLPLYDRHIKALMMRGFSEEYIRENFRSLPDSPAERYEITRQLLHKHSLRGIPGFYTRAGRWEMVNGPGILVPVKNLKGEIVSFQVRRDNPGVVTVYGAGTVQITAVYNGEKVKVTIEAYRGAQGEIKSKTYREFRVVYPASVEPGTTFKIKVFYCKDDITKDAEYSVKGPAVMNNNSTGKYIWFSSSGLQNGTGITAQPTVVIKNTDRRFWVTEGILKAETAAALTRANFIGVPGITNWKNAVGLLESLQPEQVLVAFDQEDNPRTREQEELLLQELLQKDIKAVRVAWEKEKGKGIDDLLLNENLRSEEDLLRFLGIEKDEAKTAKKVLLRVSQLFAEIAEKL